MGKQTPISGSTGNAGSLNNPGNTGSNTEKNRRKRARKNERKSKLIEAGELPPRRSQESRAKMTPEEKSAIFLADHGRPWLPRAEWIKGKREREGERPTTDKKKGN